jgi:hypothetical protein
MRDLIHDAETYYNLFSVVFLNTKTGELKIFEMSPWRNDWKDFRTFLETCSNGFVRWVGFNNYFFDYLVIHYMYQNFGPDSSGEELALAAHRKGTKLIKSSKDEKFAQIIWDNNQMVPQLDLFRIHHFDNIARATSLKVLEFNMKSETVQDLPYDPAKPLTYEQSREVIEYNVHDVRQTHKFYLETLDMIKFREELTEKYGRNFINHNDTKIGKDYFIMELENAGVQCYKFDDEGRKPVQTERPFIKIRDVIFPYIEFERPEFNAVLDWLNGQKITETKGVFTEIENLGELEQYANLKKVKGKVKNLNCIIDGFQFDFGTGGIHGSIEPTIVQEDEHNAIIDYDVTSLYPSIGIVNKVYPEHLSSKFCDIYARMKKDRLSYAKGTPENAMLKLALNGVYGDSNNKYSPFYDPKYTMTITINGQLMLCMLAEMQMKIDGVKLIQINTDGVTVKVPRDKINELEAVNKKWMEITKLDLERADYRRMFIRDVNNYIGEYTDGKLKRKGAYEYDIGWHQNHSALVVKKAVEAHLVKGIQIRDFIRNHDEPHDFMLRTKVPRTSRLMWGNEQIQNVTRYYMCDTGNQLTKVMPPLKGKDEERYIKIHDGWNVMPMNEMGDVTNVDLDFYEMEARKLVDPLAHGFKADILS